MADRIILLRMEMLKNDKNIKGEEKMGRSSNG